MADPFWDRLEPHTRDPSLEEGLQERVADALWLLARQWQVGEFRGEDAASPIHMRAAVQHHPLARFRNDAAPGAEDEPLADGRPLESRVEAEALAGPGRVARAAVVGLQLLRRVDQHGLAHLRPKLRGAFPLAVPAGTGLPAREQRRLALAARGSLDGLDAFAAGRDAVVAVAEPADQAAFGAAVDAWRAEQERLLDLPGLAGETWVDERLEHAFSVTAPAGAQEVVLRAADYPGGRLDWFAFDVAEPEPHFPPFSPPPATLDVLPVPVAYAGMPASTHWELEEGAVSFGGVEGGAADLARMIVAEFAIVYSDDYFLFPVRLPAGCIARVAEVTVWNTFGERVDVRSAAQWDEERPGTGRPWAFLELSGDPSAGAGETPWLLLAPALAASQHGPPLESVSFVRDEEANLAWAIEERVETATGGSVRRRLLAEGVAGPAAISADGAWRYRLQSPVPPYWIPFVPEPFGPDDAAQIRLRRARLLAWEELDDPTVAGPKGRVLAPARPLRIREEEIPATGAQVTRRWQLARGADGRPHLWMARTKRPGRGERGSGLGFDAIDRG